MRGIAITRQRNRTHREYIGQVNDYLRYHTGELYRLVHSMEQSGNPFEASDVLAHYRQRDDKRYVETYLLHLVEKCRNKGRYGSAQTFVSTLSVFRKFAGGRQFLLDDLDERQVLAFRDYLQDMGLKPNTVIFYMSKLRLPITGAWLKAHAKLRPSSFRRRNRQKLQDLETGNQRYAHAKSFPSETDRKAERRSRYVLVQFLLPWNVIRRHGLPTSGKHPRGSHPLPPP